MLMDRRWIKRDAAGLRSRNLALRDLSKSALGATPSRQTRLFAGRPFQRGDETDGGIEAAWDRLERVALDPAHLAARGLDPDEMGTRAAASPWPARARAAIGRHRWTHVAVTAPVARDEKSRAAVQLALGMARKPSDRVLLIDADQHRPGLAPLLGFAAPGPIGSVLAGARDCEAHLRRAVAMPGTASGVPLGALAVAAGGPAAATGPTRLSAPEAIKAVARMQALLVPDVVIYDMPPAFETQDVIAARHLFDVVLVLVDGSVGDRLALQTIERQLGQTAAVRAIHPAAVDPWIERPIT